jgi:hypothetical protein
MAHKKALVARYRAMDIFLIPDEIDLNAEGVTHYVKWSTLYIQFPDGTARSIEAQFSVAHNADFKTPDETEIVEGEHLSEYIAKTK